MTIFKRIATISFGLLITLIGGQGCYYDNAEDLYPVDTIFIPDTTPTDTLDIDTTVVLRYGADIQPILNTHCSFNGCHSANSGIRQPLTTHAEVKSAIENWALRLRVENGSMPPAGNMPEQAKQDLIDWIEAGYPNN